MGRMISYAIFSVMLVGALAYMVYDNIRYAGTASWRSVPGRVVESDFYRTGGTPRNAVTYHVRVTYAYAVDGRPFTGDEIWLTAGSSFNSPEEAAEFLAPYRAGSPVTVYYDPANPADTALIVERGGDPMVLLILAGLWGLIGTYHYPSGESSGAGQQASPGHAGGVPPGRMRWGMMLGQMAAAALLVTIAFVIYVLALGPGLQPPP